MLQGLGGIADRIDEWRIFMDWSGRLSTVAALAATIVFGAAAQTQATAPPKNVGWLYTTSHSGAVFFDADFAGHPSEEKITVCDNKSDGRGIEVEVLGYVEASFYLEDPSNDGHCASSHGNYFKDGWEVHVHVYEVWGNGSHRANDAWGEGVA
jgi:hypothetical protein